VSYTTTSVVDRVYDELRAMAIKYALRPGERLNEIELSKRLGVSRTPLREALNRLSTEGFLRFIPGRGFYCRELNPKEIFDLFELRKAIEISGIRLAVHRAKSEQLEALEQFLGETGPEAGDRTTEQLVRLDETFHEKLMEMSGNAEMLHVLCNVNARIRFVRWIDMDPAKRPLTQKEHRAVLAALRQKDEQEAIGILERHITRRLDQITSAIRMGIAQIYMGPPADSPASEHAPEIAGG
jgi:DNA-binding GntR family transcriptional regulator